MKANLLILFALLIAVSFSKLLGMLHPWTDLQGRTLQASFIKSDGVTVTINWNGKVVPIPLSSLSAESRTLAQQLSAPKVPSPPSNPFDTIAPPVSTEQLHSWTDLQGRTLKAVFIKADSLSVTVKWQGKVVPLPLANLNPASRALAKSLSGTFAPAPAPVPVSPPPVVAKPVAPPVAPPVAKSDDLSLEAEHNWKSSSGSVIKAKFISIEGDSVNLAMYGGRSERTIPLTRLSGILKAWLKNYRLCSRSKIKLGSN
jgi:hypothetical protein